MQFAEVGRESIEVCYQSGMIKPNEFRQLFINLIEKELQLRLNCVSIGTLIKSTILKKNSLEIIYQELSDCKDDVSQCIINLASSSPEKLLISEEESKKLFLSYIFYKKSLIVRDCSDIFKHPLVKQKIILVDKETLRAIDYLTTYTSSGKALLKELQ